MLEKLPNTIKLQISRKLERENGKKKNFCKQLIRKLLQEKILKIKKKQFRQQRKKHNFYYQFIVSPSKTEKVCVL